LRTFGDLKTQLEQEMDTEDETFIQPTELVGYFNTGITLIESEIIKLGLREKYLQKEAFISTIASQTDYDIPTDIVANKIRKIMYKNASTNLVYPIRPLRSEDSYETEDVFSLYVSSEYYRYTLYKVGELNKLRLTPRALNTSTNNIRIIYFAKLNRYTADATNCDVPDVCYDYLLSYVRYRIYAKESHKNTQMERSDLGNLVQLMRETLQNQVADPEMDEMDGDFSHYEEQT
jgi:hypothetical protein